MLSAPHSGSGTYRFARPPACPLIPQLQAVTVPHTLKGTSPRLRNCHSVAFNCCISFHSRTRRFCLVGAHPTAYPQLLGAPGDVSPGTPHPSDRYSAHVPRSCNISNRTQVLGRQRQAAAEGSLAVRGAVMCRMARKITVHRAVCAAHRSPAFLQPLAGRVDAASRHGCRQHRQHCQHCWRVLVVVRWAHECSGGGQQASGKAGRVCIQQPSGALSQQAGLSKAAAML